MDGRQNTVGLSLRALLLGMCIIPLAGCGKTPLRPQGALRSPSGYNDGDALLYTAPGPHPLVVVSLPNTPHGKPHVDTVLSVLIPPKTTSTAPPPPPVPPSTIMQVHEQVIPAKITATSQPATTAPAATKPAGNGGAVVPAH
jgi:hypothetical protein